MIDLCHLLSRETFAALLSTGPTHEISRLKAALKQGARAYRHGRGWGQIANLWCIALGCSCTASSLTAPRALIALISCVDPGFDGAPRKVVWQPAGPPEMWPWEGLKLIDVAPVISKTTHFETHLLRLPTGDQAGIVQSTVTIKARDSLAMCVTWSTWAARDEAKIMPALLWLRPRDAKDAVTPIHVQCGTLASETSYPQGCMANHFHHFTNPSGVNSNADFDGVD